MAIASPLQVLSKSWNATQQALAVTESFNSIAIPINKTLLNSGNKAMNVNGATTPVVFSYSPGDNTTVFLTSINLILQDAGTTDLNKFGTQTALTNGILISVTRSGVTTNMSTIKDNLDLITCLTLFSFGSAATDTLGGAVGFGNSYDIATGVWTFYTPLKLTNSDTIQITIRDNCTGIDYFMACVQGFVEVQ